MSLHFGTIFAFDLQGNGEIDCCNFLMCGNDILFTSPVQNTCEFVLIHLLNRYIDVLYNSFSCHTHKFIYHTCIYTFAYFIDTHPAV